MNEFQRIVKNLAILLAVFLSVVIIGSIATGVMAVLGMVTIFPNHFSKNVENFSQEYDANAIKSIHIKDISGKLTLMEGDSFKVEGTNINSNFKCEVSQSKTLYIGTKSEPMDWFKWIAQKNNTEITITVPKDFTADKIVIDAGAGNIELNNLVTERLDLNCGAGNITGESLMASKVTIDGGVGNINFTDIDFTDMYLDCGVGKVTMAGELYGKTDINCGVGECDLSIQNEKDEYNLNFDPGVGSIYVNGDKYGEVDNTNPSADNSLKIEGGVGNIKLDFQR